MTNDESSWNLTSEHVEKALQLTKNGSVTGMDGCPYELWKTLNAHFVKAKKSNKAGFDIIETLTRVFKDIQEHGVNERSEFTNGWMCPIYKKKDPTEISNYRPITLLNMDYKLMTKVLAI